ncbi:MAG: hypothetical protein WBW88_14410 [Rhodothermales bacterium]
MLSTAAAQVGSRNAEEPGGRLRHPAAPQYDVVALQVEFQPDSSRFSTGDGVFGGTMFEDLETRVDPLPHDETYFGAHLDFLANYLDHVSRGQTSIRTHLLPGIVRVSGTMGDYAPIGPDSDSPAQRARLQALVDEAWTIANQQIAFDASGLDPDHTAFLIFHAGTGRDIELTGTTLDRTPEDLPSLFFGPETLVDGDKSLLFKGLRVDNTALIPETESKRGVDPISDEPFLLELSINGLLAASFFNFLGVPDLFNTSDGSSAIGPYGLMDPLGIFAYGGILPPEPSAWTRFYLGWTTPFELVGPEEQEIELTAYLDQALVPVSSTEYFLAEVRRRDVDGDGLNLKVWRDGSIVEQHFDVDAQGFTSLSQDDFEGVLIDADDFDWALPGGVDDSGTLRNGGILIWHIDERVISEGLASNAVNVNPTYRGVDLEEADSAPDLGFPSGNPFAVPFDRGTPFDFYFEGNPITTITATGEVTLYANRFGPDTYPNSDSNGGGPSFVVLDNFGPAANTMSLRYSRAGTTITPVDFLTPSLDAQFGDGASVSTMVFEIGPARLQNLLYYTGPAMGTLWITRPDARFLSSIERVLTKPVVEPSPSGGDALAYLAQDDGGDVYFTRLDPLLDRPQPFVPMPAEIRLALPSTPLVGVRQGDQTEYYVGFDLGETGYVAAVRPDETVDLIAFSGGGVVSLAALADGDILVVGRDRAQTWHMESATNEWNFTTPLNGDAVQVVAGRDPLGVIAAVTSPGADRLTILGADERVVEVEVDGGSPSRWPILVDTNGDGLLEVLVTADSTLQAFSREGAPAAGFPIRLHGTSKTQPLVATFEGESRPDIVLGLTDGYLYAYNLGDRPKVREGFPLAVGGSISVTPIITDSYIYTVSASGKLAGWSIDGLSGGEWTELNGDAMNRSFVDGGTGPLPGGSDQGLIVGAETYNWPNPVQDGVTHLRVATSEPSTVEVKIIDLAGNLVHSLDAEIHTAAVPVEFEWRPNVASGVYFARVRAKTTGGRTDTKLYSIAVIR